MKEQPASQLWFKPGGFRRHYHVVVSHAKEVIDIYRIYGKCYFHIIIHSLFQFFQSADPSYEINALVCTRIFDPQDRMEQAVLQHSHIQGFCHMIREIGRASCRERV